MLVAILIVRVCTEIGAMFGPAILMRRAPAKPQPGAPSAEAPKRASRAPLAANIAALALFFSCLWSPFGWHSLTPSAYLALAACGLAMVLVGIMILFAAKSALGASWSLVPKASLLTGLASTGPYVWVRHPIYFGMSVMFLGTAVAFANWLALLFLLLLVLPTLVWRAAVEERLLVEVFGEQYIAYRHRTRMMIPYLL